MENLDNLYVTRQNVATNSIFGERDDLEPNEFMEFEYPALGEVSLVRKKTPYVENPSDMMLRIKNTKYSQVTEMEVEEGGAMLELCNEILDYSLEKYPGRPFIAINQQVECNDIPEKYAEDGTELKVQTINEVHPHLFVFPKDYSNTWNIKELEDEDFHDFYDEFAVAVSEVFVQKMSKEQNLARIAFQKDSYPVGLVFSIPKEGENFWEDTFELMQNFQSEYSEIYYKFVKMITDENGELLSRKNRYQSVKDSVKELNTSDESAHSILKMLVASVPREMEARKYLRFIQGPALTWLIECNDTEILVHPSLRFVSRGNAMESLGVWIDQGYDRQDTHLKEQLEFYDFLKNKLGKYNPQRGNIYKFIEQRDVT